MLKIRPAAQHDAETIARIHLTSWQSQFESFLTEAQVKLKDLDEANQLSVWQGRLGNEEGKSRYTFIAEIDQHPVGYITGRDYSGDYDAELHQIYVLPKGQHQGVGKQLVARLGQRLYEVGKRSMLVWVMTINPTIAFYRDALGGTLVDERLILDGDGILKEAAYVWSDIGELFS